MQLGPIARVDGEIRVPGDKSIGHRSLLFGALAAGSCPVVGLPSGGDVRTTLAVIRALGVRVDERGDQVVVHGTGWAGFDGSPAEPLWCGNSGTTTRLLLGVLAGRSGRKTLTGDPSLSRRPMGRVIRPLTRLGAEFELHGDGLPLTVIGARLRGAELRSEVASAQVKSASILAALQAEGASVVSEPAPTRDHTERMLLAMGAPLRQRPDGGWDVGGGAAPLQPVAFTVPGDPSSAAFLVALAAARPGSVLRVEGVGLNPRRIGFLRVLARMGAQVTWEVRGNDPEPWGAIEVRGGSLVGTEVDGADVVDAIDELPVLAVAASQAEGTTTIRGAAELKVKESDRIASTAALLRGFGASCEPLDDGWVIRGPAKLRGARIEPGMDHRIAMAGAVAAACADGPSELDGHEWAAVSYPTFFDDLRRISA
ncbi:MAG: 3-phosphoshikimate 1-carboxyvinyltransferase [Myxococcota bacterium]